VKIAVPVEGENLKIVKRTGQAPFFALFDDAELSGIVEAPQGHAHDEHDHDEDHGDDEEHIKGHGKSLANLEGVELLLVQAIGTHMKAAVDRAGIAVKKLRQRDGECADEAVRNFLQGAHQ
jgi:predicted Fe-Mo cluster-binding NifX family protein